MKTLNRAVARVLKRLHYPPHVILTCVRWYVSYALSLRNLEEMMAERGISVDHSTVHRWALKLLPVLEKAFRRHKRPVGKSWRVDETYIKVKGEWKYLYRAVDKAGNAIDFLLWAHRDKTAARRYFEKSIVRNGEPETVTIDKSGANMAALEAINAERQTPNAHQEPADEVLEQYNRTGPPRDQAAYPPHAQVQEFLVCTHPAWWNRGGSHDRQGADERQRRPTNFRRTVLFVGCISSPMHVRISSTCRPYRDKTLRRSVPRGSNRPMRPSMHHEFKDCVQYSGYTCGQTFDCNQLASLCKMFLGLPALHCFGVHRHIVSRIVANIDDGAIESLDLFVDRVLIQHRIAIQDEIAVVRGVVENFLEKIFDTSSFGVTVLNTTRIGFADTPISPVSARNVEIVSTCCLSAGTVGTTKTSKSSWYRDSHASARQSL